MSEQVLVIPTEMLWQRTPWFQGAQAATVPANALLDGAEYRDRDKMEDSPDHKQLIPYLVLCRTRDDERQLLVYRRTGSGGESRLFDKWSLGFGGHVNPQDWGSGTVWLDVLRAASRELAEELVFSQVAAGSLPHYGPQFVGLINDDDSPVGRVHLGLLCIVPVRPEVTVTPREAAIADLQWLPFDTVQEQMHTSDPVYEAWSQLALPLVFAHFNGAPA